MPEKTSIHQEAKLLVVDGEEAPRNLVVGFLSRDGMQTLQASSAKDALKIIAEHPELDLVLLDWDASRQAELDLLTTLCEQDDPPPVIIMSTRSERECVLRALQAGAADFLPKPLQRDMLIFKIDNILEKNREQARARAARRKPVSFDALCEFTILDVSETHLRLESTFPVEAESVIFFESEDLSIKLDLPREHRYAARVKSAQGKANRFHLSCELAGVTQDLQQRIRRVSQSGGWAR